MVKYTDFQAKYMNSCSKLHWNIHWVPVRSASCETITGVMVFQSCTIMRNVIAHIILVQSEFCSFLALLVENQVSLCDTLSSVVRSSVCLSVQNILFLYLIHNQIPQIPIFGDILLAPWSSCACAFLVQSGPPVAPQGDIASQRPNCSLIL